MLLTTVISILLSSAVPDVELKDTLTGSYVETSVKQVLPLERLASPVSVVYLKELEERGIRADVVVVDPPRKGLNADAIEALCRFAPRKIVYVSCDPATLARDVALLKDRGYAVKNAQAADLFPRCAHIESIVTMIWEG